VPFCLKKCSYCDFYSTDALSFLPAYVNSLQQEIEIRTGQSGRPGLPGPAPKKARTIYFGGGTPSLLPLEAVGKILETVYTCYQVSGNAELTFEVNPGTVDELYLSGLKKLGVNRLSIGIQSFDATKIKVLGRIHTIEQSIGTIEAAKSAGFENIGLDLIYGTPGETREKWIQDLKMAIKFRVSHLSCYMLTLEPGTPLGSLHEKGLFLLPGPDSLADLFMATATFLGQQGYEHYEISNFARGRQNRSCHNSNYWQMTPYDGFGPSAHSLGFLTDRGQDAGDIGTTHTTATAPLASPVRSWNPADVNAYVESLSAGRLLRREKEILSLQQQMLERIMLGLRTSDGLDITAFGTLLEGGFLTVFGSLVARLETQKLGAVVNGPGKEEGRAGQTGLVQTGLVKQTGSVTKNGPAKQIGLGKRFQLTLAGRARLDSIVEAFVDKIF